ncbi:MAG: hypothetical protein U5L00_07325 [Desulfovermiculus sp.]|nr:hypothetical protein [Desulfovermiculus sp.]
MYQNETIRVDKPEHVPRNPRQLQSALNTWAKIFNQKLFHPPIPEPQVVVHKLRITTLGRFLPEQARSLLIINRKRLERPLYELLISVLHQMVHAQQWAHGLENGQSPYWYHSIGFRKEMARLGIQCNAKGQAMGLEPESVFIDLLRKHGVGFQDMEPCLKAQGRINLEEYSVKGESNLRKWSCGCTNIRAAVRVRAVCLKCGVTFSLQD